MVKYGADNLEVYHSNFTPLEAAVPHRLDNGCYAKLVCNKADNVSENILNLKPKTKTNARRVIKSLRYKEMS